MAAKFHDKYLRQLPKKWNADAVSIMKTASVLAEAKRELPKSIYKKLPQHLGFSERQDQRLRKIGNTKRLYDPIVLTSLPDSWGTIEKISLLSAKKFQELLDSGKLKPSIKRSEVDEFRLGKKNTLKKDWSETDRLLTIRVRGVIDPEEADKIVSEFQYTAEGLNREFDSEVVQIEDYKLPEKIEKQQKQKALREIERASKEGLKVGKQICRYVTQQMKKQQPDWLKKQVRRGHKNTTWSMEENHSPQDYDDLRHAFGELNVDVDVEMLKHDPEIGRRYLEKLKQ